MLRRWLTKIRERFGSSPSAADRLVSEAAALLTDGKLEQARGQAEAALAAAPRSPSALHLCGIVRCALGELASGLECLREAVRRDGKNPALRFDLANALVVAGDKDAAELEYRAAIGTAPESSRGRISLGKLLLDLARPGEAMAVFQEALRISPGDREAELGSALAAFRCHDYGLAVEIYRRLAAERALGGDEVNCLGVALQYVGDLDSATSILRQLLEGLPPDSSVRPIVARNLAYCCLMAGDWTEGFRLHEGRQKAIRLMPTTPESIEWLDFVEGALNEIPPWDGSPIAGKRLLVWSEQGQGDVIMLLRFLPMLTREWGADSVALLGPTSNELLVSMLPGIAYIPASPAWRPARGAFDVQCSIMSLPYLMHVTPGNIPGRPPYLHVPRSKQTVWADRTAQLPGLKVGICWAGNPKLTMDILRSVSLDQLGPVLETGHATFVSLQKDATAREELRSRNFRVVDWMDECHDFADTAALIAGLDLVISVDTAVAHLAGAIGKPVWLLNRFESEWRWLRGRKDSVWYPTMRLFNQTAPRDWQPIIATMAGELRELAAQ